MTGKTTAIKAEKLLIAISPISSNTEPFDLDANEQNLFNKWQWISYHTAVVNNSGIPSDINFANLDPTQPYDLSIPPFQWGLEYMGVPGYLASKIITDNNLTAQDARDLVIFNLQGMKDIFPI